MSDTNAERHWAEIFDVLGHPVRLRILKTLDKKPMSFSELKKETNIASSGHLDYHMSKLDGLIKTDDNGKYVLSDQGKDALFTVGTVEQYSTVEKKTKRRFSITSRRIALATLCLSILIFTVGVYVSNMELSVTNVTTENQYYYKIVEGDKNVPADVSYGRSFNAPVGSVFNITNVVVKDLPSIVDQGWSWVMTEAALPLNSATVNRSTYTVFNVEISLPHLWNATFMITGPNGTRIFEEFWEISGETNFSSPFSAPISGYGNYTLSIVNLTNQNLTGYLNIYCSEVTEIVQPVVGDSAFDSGQQGRVTTIYSVPITHESIIPVKPYVILGQMVSYASLIAIGALSILVISRGRHSNRLYV